MRPAICAVVVVLALTGAARTPLGASGPVGLTDDQLFQLDRIWSIDVDMTAAEWASVQPTVDRDQPVSGVYLGGAGHHNGIAAAAGFEFPWSHATLDIEGHHFADVGIRYKGNGTFLQSLKTGKMPLKIDTNQFVKGQKIGRISTFNLHNAITDPSWMRESLAYELLRDAGVPAPRTSYARVFLTVTGQARRYLGLYTVTENVDHDFAAARFGTKDGALFKPVTITPFEDLGDQWAHYAPTFDAKTTPTDAEEARTIAFSKFVAHAKDDDFARRLGDFVALEPFATFIAVSVWLGNPDSFIDGGKNYYMFLDPRTAAFHFVPWDEDDGFGRSYVASSDDLQQQDIDAPSRRGGNRFLERVFKVPAFRALYHAEMRRLVDTLARPERLAGQVRALVPILRPAVSEESAELLKLFDAEAADRAVMREGNPFPIVPIVVFAEGRDASVRYQLDRIKK